MTTATAQSTSPLAETDLRVGTYRYGTTRALLDGSVQVAGARSTEASTRRTLPDVFTRLVDREVDVSEFGLTFLLRALDAGEPYVALPAFPNRVFRHSCVYVSAASGITRPEELVGRTIGEYGVYGQDSGVWAKGILADDFGFRPEANRWVIGGLEQAAPRFDWTTHPVPAGLDVTYDAEHSLSDLLVSGEIDALFTANVPQVVQDGTDAVRQLFPDFVERERDWFTRTGIFPMMHTVAVRRETLEAHPGLARAAYEAFLEAKDQAVEEFRQSRRIFQVPAMLPWSNDLYERDVALMGEDWWPYGLAANRTALKTYLRYHREQGLSSRLRSVEELFAPELLDT